MENVIFILTFAVLSFNFFMASYRIVGVNRVFLNIPISIFESSIPLAQETDEPRIYYDKEQIRSKLTSYLDNDIKKYCDSYALNIRYYVQDDNSYCINLYCDAVEVSLTAKVLFNYEYHRTAKFYIQDNR